MQKQHYVPRVYLKSFTYDGSHLYVYNKPTDELLPEKRSSINDTASEMNFYALPEDMTEGGDTNEVEKWLQNFDGRFANLRAGILNSVTSGEPIDSALRKGIAEYLGVQMVRLKGYREVMKELYRLAIERYEQTEGPLVRPTPEHMRLFHANHMRRDMAPLVAVELAARRWIIGINKTSSPLFTSDSPLVLRELYEGAARIGDMIAFPITPTCILMMYDGAIVERLSGYPYGHYILAEASVELFNFEQMAQSYLRVYSKFNHFNECRHICDENPEFRTFDGLKQAARRIMETSEARDAEEKFHTMMRLGIRPQI